MDYWKHDATSLARLLDAGTVTPSDLLEMYLDRCARLEPSLKAFAYLDAAGARQAADEATKRQRAGRRLGRLDGIPVSVKDNLYVAGLPASWGSLMFKDHVPQRDEICVERLRKAGAVIVGKTTTPEFSLLMRTQNRIDGITRNPWDLALTAGGSSGGSVAAIAAGMVPLSVGTDALGSTRTPASFTGLVGLRPSSGRVPRCYSFPTTAIDFQAIGLMCRTMADLDLMLAFLAGADRRDPVSLNLPPMEAPSARLRIGWFVGIGAEGVDDEVAETHRAAREALAAFGHELVECEAPFDLKELRAIWDLLAAVSAARVASLHPNWESDATPVIAALARQGLTVSAIDHARMIDRLQAFRRETGGRWGDYDAILTPTTAAPAWQAELDAPPVIGGKPGNGGTLGMFCGWVNAMGYAGLSVPGRPHPDGRPIGLQIVAPFGRDGIALEIGRQLEKAMPWADRWPALATSLG